LNQCSQGDRAQKAHPITSALKKTKSAAQLTTFITRVAACRVHAQITGGLITVLQEHIVLTAASKLSPGGRLRFNHFNILVL